MATNSAAAGRVATTIGVFKWVVIAGQVLYGVIVLLVFNAQEDWPTWTAIAGPLALVMALLSALGTWVLFGWFQHTLGMLVTIAENTRRVPGGPVSSGQPFTIGEPLPAKSDIP